MCKSTIQFSLSKSVYYNVKNAEGGVYALWQRIYDMYDKHSAASQVYWIKINRFIGSRSLSICGWRKVPLYSHLNEFNTIFSQLAT